MRTSTFVSLAVSLACSAAIAQTIDRMKLTDGELTCVQIYAETHQMDSVIALNAGAPAPRPAVGGAPVTAAPAAPAANDPVASGFASALAGAFGGTTNAAAAGGLAPNQAGIPMGVYADPRVQASIQRARAAGYSDAQITQMMQLGAARAGYPVGATMGGQYQAAGQAAQAAQAPAPAPAAAAAPALGSLFGALAGRGGLGGAQAGNFLGAAMQGAAAPAPAPATMQPVAVAPAPAGNMNLAAQARARKEHLTSLFLSKGCKVSDMPK